MALTKVSTDGVKDDAITSGKIPANAVGASELADNAVDTNAIANNAVTAGKTSGVQTTINNNADNRVITGSGTANTLNGESDVAIDGSDRLLVGSGSVSNPQSNHGGLDVSSGKLSIVYGGTAATGNGETRVNSSIQEARLATPHYNLSEEPFTNIAAFSKSSENELNIGGGTGLGNNATEINFHVAANTTTTGANQKWQIASDADFIGTSPAVIHSGSSSGSLTLYGGATNHGGEITLNGGNSTADIVFKAEGSTASPAERARILASGGITFNGDTATANALDDYEEGTWTPVYQSGGGSLTVNAYSIQEGRYTKIGNMVYVEGGIRANVTNNSTGSWDIGGLPFTAVNDTNSSGIIHCKEQSSWTVAPHHFSVMANNQTARARGGIDVGDASYAGLSTTAFNTGSTNNNRVFFAGAYRAA